MKSRAKKTRQASGAKCDQARFSCSAVHGELPMFMVPLGQVVNSKLFQLVLCC